MTVVDVDSKMATCLMETVELGNNTQEILTKRAYLEVSKLNISGTHRFDVKVLGFDSCSDYEFLYVVLNNGSCDYVISCIITHDLAESHTSCVVSYPCDGNCGVVVNLYNVTNGTTGSVCEVKLLI